MHFIVFSGTAARVAETNEAALKIGGSNVDIAMHILDFRDGFLPYEGARPKDSLIEISKDLRPDLIFTHYGRDRHQDHRIVSEITWNIFRDNLILEYEIPKYDGDLGNPNLYCEMSSEQLDKKIEILETCFVSQASKHWFNDETFRSLARIRGLESGANGSYAEAFYLNKGVFRI
jgi:LmbE family N-acetylglucosaminyl deacetylase